MRPAHGRAGVRGEVRGRHRRLGHRVPARGHGLPRPLAGRLEHEGEELRVDEDYAVRWDGPADRRIFVQNGVRGQRGLADPNLSLNAWRSRRIADRLCGVRADEQLASFIEWSSKAPQDERWSA